VPLFLCGHWRCSSGLPACAEQSLLAWVEKGLEPVLTGILDLPPQAAEHLRPGISQAGLRRRRPVRPGTARGAYGTADVVSMVVITLFVPCLASFLIIAREHGLRRALAITAFIVPLRSA